MDIQSTTKKAEHNPIRKLRNRPESLRMSINAFCAQCMGCTDESIEPGFREQVRNCTAPRCALYAVRPYQQKEDDENGNQ